MTLVEQLRSKKSRDNRELLDQAADRIEELEKEKSEVASKIFAEIEKIAIPFTTPLGNCLMSVGIVSFELLKKKYTEDQK